MTAQFMDSIDFAGQVYQIACEPLRPWLNIRRNRKLRFYSDCSALWRGYRTRWAVIDGSLFLTAFSAKDRERKELDLSSLFPDAGDQVAASWYSGAIVCPMGKLLRYEHCGYGSVYEYDLILWFIEGHLVEQRINRNPQGPTDPVEKERWFDEIDEDMRDGV